MKPNNNTGGPKPDRSPQREIPPVGPRFHDPAPASPPPEKPVPPREPAPRREATPVKPPQRTGEPLGKHNNSENKNTPPDDLYDPYKHVGEEGAPD